MQENMSFNLDLEVGKHTFSLDRAFCYKPNRDMEEASFALCRARKSTPPLVLSSISSGLQHLPKAS